MFNFKMTKKTKKLNLQLWLGFGLAVFGVLLIIASFICPPTGIIHPSVLASVGEVFTFSAGLIGVDYHYAYKKYQQEHQDSEEE